MARHSRASRVTVTLEHRDADLVLEVRDDGVGIARGGRLQRPLDRPGRHARAGAARRRRLLHLRRAGRRHDGPRADPVARRRTRERTPADSDRRRSPDRAAGAPADPRRRRRDRRDRRGGDAAGGPGPRSSARVGRRHARYRAARPRRPRRPERHQAASAAASGADPQHARRRSIRRAGHTRRRGRLSHERSRHRRSSSTRFARSPPAAGSSARSSPNASRPS